MNYEVTNRHISERRLQNILDKKNAELEDEYKTKIKIYNDNKRSWVEKEMRKKSIMSWLITIAYLVTVLVLLYVIIKYNSIWAIVIEVITVTAFALGFFVDRLKSFLQSSIKYAFVEKERIDYRNSLEAKYLQNNTPPIQQILKAEDFD